MSDDEPKVGRHEVVEVAQRLADEEDVFLVGGQATNLWAWHFQGTHPGLPDDQDLVTKDIDYYGSKAVARRLAAAMDGIAYFPDPNHMNTVNTAVVTLTIQGKPLNVDFVHAILGIERKKDIERGIASLSVPTITNAGDIADVTIKLLHPVNCLKSRIGNMLSPATRRTDEVARRQLAASVCVVDAFIEGALASGQFKEAQRCFREIFLYTCNHQFGKRCQVELGIDLINILAKRKSDNRIDERYRTMTLKPMVADMKSRKQKLETRIADGKKKARD